jgi:hypothetical protein
VSTHCITHFHTSLHLPTSQKLEAGLWISRVALAYDQMLVVFAAYPEVWHEYAKFHTDGGGAGPDAAVSVLKRATVALPG